MDSVIGTTVVFLLLTCNGASRTVEVVQQRPTREGRKDFILHDLGTERPNRARRATISAESNLDIDIRRVGDDGDANKNASHLHFMNAYTDDSNVTVQLNDEIFSLAYGDILVADLGRKLDLHEFYSASVGNDSYTDNVSSSVTGVPDNADVFLITDVGNSGQLRDTLSVWRRNKPLCDGCFWLLSYNGFSHSGLDVLVFDASKVGTEHYSLLRIGMSIESFDAYYVELKEATYELKVVVHNTVLDIDDFKNTPSLTPPLFIHPKPKERYYGAIIGIYNEPDKFHPDYKSVPPLPKAQPVPYLPTHVVVINAFPNDSSVNINFANNHRFKDLPFGNVSVAQFDMKQYDIYEIKLGRKGPRYRSHVHVPVPYIESECVLIVDMGISGALENLLLCRQSMAYDQTEKTLPYHGLVMTYHALNNYSTPIDVLLFDHSKLNDPNQHSLFSIADGIVLGDGVPSTLPTGSYKVKVVPSGTIKNSRDFKRARSLLPVFTIQLKDGAHYYLVLSGIFASKKYQPRRILYENIEIESTSTVAPTASYNEVLDQTGDLSGSTDVNMHSDSRYINGISDSRYINGTSEGRSDAVRWASSSSGIVSLLTVLVATLLW